MEHIAVTHFLKVFEKSEEKFEKKSVYKWRNKREWFDNKSFF